MSFIIQQHSTMNPNSQGKTYIITSTNLPNKAYIGSTTATLDQRLKWHESEYRNTNKNIASFLFIKAGDYRIDLIEDYPCESKKELERYEGFTMLRYIDAHKADNTQLQIMNHRIAGRTHKEWREANAEHLQAYRDAYYAKPENIQKKKDWSQQSWTCNICDTTLSRQHMNRHLSENQRCLRIREIGKEAYDKEEADRKEAIRIAKVQRDRDRLKDDVYREQNKERCKERYHRKKDDPAEKAKIKAKYQKDAKRITENKRKAYASLSPEELKELNAKRREANNVQMPCPYCAKMMGKASISRHKKTCKQKPE